MYRTGPGTWKFQVALLNGNVIVDEPVSNPGFDGGGNIGAGGEVHSPTHINDMGVSSFTSLKWMNDQSEWQPWNGKDSVAKDRPYKINAIQPIDGNNFQVFGNNENPVPFGAPCP